MANKQARIESIIRKNLSNIIQFELNDPRIGFISIPEVKVSSDFSHAKVFVSFFNEKDEKKGLEVLNGAKGFIRSRLASMLDRRRCPDISFELDEGYKAEERITEILNKSK